MPEIFIASQLSLILEYLNPKIQIVGKNMFKNYASHLSLALNLYLIMVKIIDYSRNCESLWKVLETIHKCPYLHALISSAQHIQEDWRKMEHKYVESCVFGLYKEM